MTTFEITTKPIRTLMTIEDVEVVIGTKYNINLQSEVKLLNSTGFYGEPFDLFKYKINKDSVASLNEGIVKINFVTNKVGLPTIVDSVKNLNIKSHFLFSEFVLPDSRFDRVIINSITGKGLWTYNGNPLYVGQVFFLYNILSNIVFQSNELVVESNYNVITWKTANINEVHNQVNTLTTNTTGSIITLTDFYFKGTYTADDIREPNLNSWVDYIDSNGDTQRFIIGPSENGCQLVSAISIVDYNDCESCVQII